MKGKLVKEYGDFYLISDKEIESGDEYVKLNNRPRTLLLGTTVASAKVPKLSLKNCESIANGYDLDELFSKIKPKDGFKHELSFIEGFQKALEILGDKKFSEEDIKKAFNVGWIQRHNEEGSHYEAMEKVIQSLQQTEWDVEICCYVDNSNGWLDADSFNSPLLTNTGIPKLDTDGFLILKRL
jgi:hypothetical protein